MAVLWVVVCGLIAACSPGDDHDIDDSIENGNRDNSGGNGENGGNGDNGEAGGTGSEEDWEPAVSVSVKGVKVNMVLVEGGTFQMGATREQYGDNDFDEHPVHQVTLSSFYMAETEVTQGLWLAVMGHYPSHFSGSHQLPVENVSWDYCQEFIQKLNKLTGVQFRLPTEAEWEFAARGGKQSKEYKFSGSPNVDEVGWYSGNSDLMTHEVATKDPNELGLYDMSGNVSEWCQDWYADYSDAAQTNPTGGTSQEMRVFRGGCWADIARVCRVSSRWAGRPSSESMYRGLRLALSPSSLSERKDDEKPDTNHQYVDLGLPSGTLWATCNIGARSPDEYGDYFAWGMTVGYDGGRTYFDWSTYQWCNGSNVTLTKYNTYDRGYGINDDKTVLDLADDAAYVNWGKEWRMPSKEQLEELVNPRYTVAELYEWDEVSGMKVTSRKNGNSIFLPAAGYRSLRYLVDDGWYGDYWSREISDQYPDWAWALHFASPYYEIVHIDRCSGYSIRPVRYTE